MLVLSRHRDEKIVIGKDVVITVVEIRGDKVRLGIDAPKDIPVHRQEIFEANQAKASPPVAEAVADVKPKTMADYVQNVTAHASKTISD